jgi:hypothetical protein
MFRFMFGFSKNSLGKDLINNFFFRNQELPQGFSNEFGFATIGTYTVQADDEEYGGLGGKH